MGSTITQNELSSKLREMFNDTGIPVQLIVEDIDFVNNNLEEKQYFFTDIKREGKVLFNSEQHELVDSKQLTPVRRREIAEEDFKQWFGQANEMFDYYLLGREKNYLGSAAFHLQQVIEMCYTTIEMVFTHYNPYEHYLKILKERVLEFDQRVEEALPYETDDQKKLFDYLDYAYIGGRYRSEEEFPVTKEQLDHWSREAKKLLGLTETICKDRIECLREIEQELKTKS